MEIEQVTELFWKLYLESNREHGRLNIGPQDRFTGCAGFRAIADHITGLEKEIGETKSRHLEEFWQEAFSKAQEDRNRKFIVIEEQEKRLRENSQEINNLKAEVKDLAESREAVKKQLKYADDAVASLHKENRSMDIQGYDYVGAESVGAYGSGQTYIRIWRKK